MQRQQPTSIHKHAKFRDGQFFQKVYAKRNVRVFRVVSENGNHYLDTYDEQTDTSEVQATLTGGFKPMKNLDYWNPLQWRGKSGAALHLNSMGEFAGVFLFRIYVREPVRLEMSAGPLRGFIDLNPGWRWIELEQLDLQKAQNELQFQLAKSNSKTFQISEVIFFGRKFLDPFNQRPIKTLEEKLCQK